MMLAISAAGAALTTVQQHTAMKSQEQYNDKERAATLETRNQNLAQVDLQQQQATAQASDKINQNNIQAAKAMSTTQVSAGENGISGLSVDSLLSELDGTRGSYNASVEGNLRDATNEMANQRVSINNGTTSAINQLKTPQAPDYVGAALKIGAAYNNYKNPPKTGGKA